MLVSLYPVSLSCLENKHSYSFSKLHIAAIMIASMSMKISDFIKLHTLLEVTVENIGGMDVRVEMYYFFTRK